MSKWGKQQNGCFAVDFHLNQPEKGYPQKAPIRFADLLVGQLKHQSSANKSWLAIQTFASDTSFVQASQGGTQGWAETKRRHFCVGGDHECTHMSQCQIVRLPHTMWGMEKGACLNNGGLRCKTKSFAPPPPPPPPILGEDGGQHSLRIKAWCKGHMMEIQALQAQVCCVTRKKNSSPLAWASEATVLQAVVSNIPSFPATPPTSAFWLPCQGILDLGEKQLRCLVATWPCQVLRGDGSDDAL